MKLITKALARQNIRVIVEISILSAVAILAPLIGNAIGKQAITGPIVNATLFIAIIRLRKEQAFLVALIPSCIALGVGLLPTNLAPMVPFIMLSNILLMLVFKWSKQGFNYFVSVFIASFAKFAFLALTSYLILDRFLKTNVAAKVAQMMNWPQLVTALLGGLLAWSVLYVVNKNESGKNRHFKIK